MRNVRETSFSKAGTSRWPVQVPRPNAEAAPMQACHGLAVESTSPHLGTMSVVSGNLSQTLDIGRLAAVAPPQQL